MNRLLILLLALLAATPFAWHHFKVTRSTRKLPAVFKTNTAAALQMARLRQYAGKLKAYAEKNEFNTRYCFLADMKITCGNNRFFVFDMQKDTVVQAGLVTHGYGNSNPYSVNFSNEPGSNSTSLGKYKIGNSYTGRFGLAWKLYGLDKTNSNAYNRFVVLHSHDCVPARSIAPLPICMSQGCPTVAPVFLQQLKKYLDGSDTPVLLWIFN